MPDVKLMHQVFQALIDTIAAYEATDKLTRNFGTDTPIYHAEIRMISAIAKYPDMHVSGLAEHFGFTKGAVSEIVRKLEKKKLVRKEKDPKNLTRTCMYLTEKGELAHRTHMEYHQVVETAGLEILQNFSDEQAKGILDFLNAFMTRIPEFENLS